jgi:predicted alpha/beta-hydrolase family hydrolase
MSADPREASLVLPGGQRTTALLYRAFERTAARPAALVLAHGAGAPQRHPFMEGFARALSGRGLDVLTFNFLYAEQKRKVPDRMPLLVACYRAAIDGARAHLDSARDRLFIGGKSMGGRVATHVAAEDAALPLNGLVLLGYPLHPPGRPDSRRDAHLPHVGRPMLFVQGSRDTFGTPSELEPILARLTPKPALYPVDGGDHSFRISGRDAKTRQPDVYTHAQDFIAAWINRATPS